MWAHTCVCVLLVMVQRNTALSSCSKKMPALRNHPVHPEPAGTGQSRSLSAVTRHQFGTGRPCSNRSNSLSINEKSPWRLQSHDYVISEKVDLNQSHPQRHRHWGTRRGFGHGYPRRQAHGTPIFKQALFAKRSSHLWTKNFPLETQRSVFFLVIELILKKKKLN